MCISVSAGFFTDIDPNIATGATCNNNLVTILEFHLLCGGSFVSLLHNNILQKLYSVFVSLYYTGCCNVCRPSITILLPIAQTAGLAWPGSAPAECSATQCLHTP